MQDIREICCLKCRENKWEILVDQHHIMCGICGSILTTEPALWEKIDHKDYLVKLFEFTDDDNRYEQQMIQMVYDPVLIPFANTKFVDQCKQCPFYHEQVRIEKNDQRVTEYHCFRFGRELYDLDWQRRIPCILEMQERKQHSDSNFFNWLITNANSMYAEYYSSHNSHFHFMFSFPFIHVDSVKNNQDYPDMVVELEDKTDKLTQIAVNVHSRYLLPVVHRYQPFTIFIHHNLYSSLNQSDDPEIASYFAILKSIWHQYQQVILNTNYNPKEWEQFIANIYIAFKHEKWL